MNPVDAYVCHIVQQNANESILTGRRADADVLDHERGRCVPNLNPDASRAGLDRPSAHDERRGVCPRTTGHPIRSREVAIALDQYRRMCARRRERETARPGHSGGEDEKNGNRQRRPEQADCPLHEGRDRVWLHQDAVSNVHAFGIQSSSSSSGGSSSGASSSGSGRAFSGSGSAAGSSSTTSGVAGVSVTAGAAAGSSVGGAISPIAQTSDLRTSTRETGWIGLHARAIVFARSPLMIPFTNSPIDCFDATSPTVFVMMVRITRCFAVGRVVVTWGVGVFHPPLRPHLVLVLPGGGAVLLRSEEGW